MNLLKLEREILTENSTIGLMSLNGNFFCYTLEDVVRADGVKVYGETAIPEGLYEVIVTPSNRFKKWMFLLVGVQNFQGIRIHSGNDAVDTDGCILVGKSKTDNHIWQSQIALQELFDALCLPDGLDTDPKSPAFGKPKYKMKEETKIQVTSFHPVDVDGEIAV